MAKRIKYKSQIGGTAEVTGTDTRPVGVSAYEFEEGSLILDFVDPESNKLIWRGSAKAQIDSVDTPEKREKLINAAVNEILGKYPPSSSK